MAQTRVGANGPSSRRMAYGAHGRVDVHRGGVHRRRGDRDRCTETKRFVPERPAEAAREPTRRVPVLHTRGCTLTLRPQRRTGTSNGRSGRVRVLRGTGSKLAAPHEISVIVFDGKPASPDAMYEGSPSTRSS